ncbi:MAG TPA: hypothetical protein VN048_19230 [Verrucomicrobiae bacterium]|jgi:hypothetical protein|nr:hypothetical protein [Verrucomicrobiae bacterium]
MSLRPAATRLTAVTRELSSHWGQTKNFWHDLKSREFEKKYLEELIPTVDRTVALMEQLDKLLSQIKHDCE